MKLVGDKYQYFIGDKLVVLRLVNTDKEKKINTVCDAFRPSVSIKITDEELKSCVKLIPDAIMNILHTQDKDGNDDVFICVNKVTDLKENNTVPCIVLSQSAYNQSMNLSTVGNTIYVGQCDNIVDFPSDNFASLLNFDKIISSTKLSLYLDDTLESISKLFRADNPEIKNINSLLLKLKHKYENVGDVIGYCSNLKELLKTQDFIYHFRRVYNIYKLDFPINLGNNVKDDNIILNRKQQLRIERMLGAMITDVVVIQYDKDIDVSKLVGTSHIMVSDVNDIIYLIKYTSTGIPVDDYDPDIAQAMKVIK